MDLEPILARLDRIERNQQRILEKLKGEPIVQHSSGSIPESFLPGGKDWFLYSSPEEIAAFNRERGARDRRGKRTKK